MRDDNSGARRLPRAVAALIGLVLGVLLVTTAAAQRSVMIFTFDSGGASHPEGFGAWRVHVDGYRVEFAHTVREDVTNYPPAILTEEELASLWRLIDLADRAADTPGQDTVTKPTPGESVMTFTLTRGATTRLLSAAGTSAASAGIVDLLRFVSDLIHRHTGQRPVMG